MKVGLTASSFDLLHAGHVLMLAEAKTQCDWLICALQTDPTIDRPLKNKPIQSVFERYTQLKGCRFVDEIIPYETELDLMAILTSYNIDVRIIGEDYMGKDFTGRDLDIPIYYNSRKHTFSSTNLRQSILNDAVERANRLVTTDTTIPMATSIRSVTLPVGSGLL